MTANFWVSLVAALATVGGTAAAWVAVTSQRRATQAAEAARAEAQELSDVEHLRYYERLLDYERRLEDGRRLYDQRRIEALSAAVQKARRLIEQLAAELEARTEDQEDIAAFYERIRYAAVIRQIRLQAGGQRQQPPDELSTDMALSRDVVITDRYTGRARFTGVNSPPTMRQAPSVHPFTGRRRLVQVVIAARRSIVAAASGAVAVGGLTLLITLLLHPLH